MRAEDQPRGASRQRGQRRRGHKKKREPREPPQLVEGKITRLAPQKRHPDRVSVHINGSFAFGVMQELLLTQGLSVGQVLSVEAQQALIDESDYMRARAKAYDIIAYRPRSEHELREKLTEKGFAARAVERTIVRLKELGYIDDERFTQRFIRDRLQNHKQGRRRIQRDLQKKGIDPALIDLSIEEVDEEDVVAAASEGIKRRWERLLRDPLQPSQRRKKAYDFLARRGFNGGVIRRALDALTTEGAQEAEDARADEPTRRARPEVDVEALTALAQRRAVRLVNSEPVPRKRTQKLQDFLRRRGAGFDVARSVASRALAEAEAELAAHEEEIDEDDIEAQEAAEEAAREEVRALAQDRWRKILRLEKNPRKQKQKLHDFLRRRGFSYDLIKSATEGL